MGQDDTNGQREGQTKAQGEPLPKEGDQGDISIETKSGNTVKKNADEENPALLITHSSPSQQDDVKRASEVEVIGHDADEPKGAGESNTAEGDGAKQTDSLGSGSNSRKRKEQASTPTKKQATKGRAGGESNNNSGKKVRTGKEDDIFGSDFEEDEKEDDKHNNENDEDIVLKDADPVVAVDDPDETEDEKDKPLAAADDAREGGQGQHEEKKEDVTTDTNTNIEPTEPTEPTVVRKPHGHSKSLGENIYNPMPTSLEEDDNKSISTASGETKNSNKNNEKEKKTRSASASAASGKSGNAVVIPRNGHQPGSGGATNISEEQDGHDDDKPKRKGSINKMLNKYDQTSQDTDRVPSDLPPGQAKEVAEEKIAGASGAEDHGSKTACETGQEPATEAGEADTNGGAGGSDGNPP